MNKYKRLIKQTDPVLAEYILGTGKTPSYTLLIEFLVWLSTKAKKCNTRK